MARRIEIVPKNEVPPILNDSGTDSNSDSELDSLIDSNESDDHAEAEADRPTGSDNDSE